MKSFSKRSHLVIGGIMVIVGLSAGLALAAPAFFGFEAESGTLSTATKVPDTTASAGNALQFSASTGTFDPHAVLPPGSPLPSDATCATRVTAAPEVRPQMASYNATAGRNKGLTSTYGSRVTGAYTGTSDQIMQWTACKWGLDVDIVRAQAAKESWWTMTTLGDFGSNASSCPPDHPLGADGRPGQCPESFGLLQVRYPYHGPPAGLNTWPEAVTSTAYNADYAYSVWRSCFEGEQGWLNNYERGEDYRAGDAWGCVGLWFAGRWKTADANTYTAAVQDYKNQKIWTNPDFVNFR